MAFLDAELITDETTVAETILTGMADRINAALDLAEGEGWEPAEGSPETSFAEAVGVILATGASLIQDQERNDFAGFGETVLGIERTSAEPAIGYSRWEFSAVGTYLIPDGSEITMTAVNGEPIAYATVGDVEVNGIEATDVQVIALEPGVQANGLLGDAIDWEPLPFVVKASMTTAPTGGTEEQTRDQYVEVVARRARRMKIVPIVTDDYAEAALDVPGVYAALAVRHLNAEAYPGPPASEGHVKIFLRGADGGPVESGVKDAVIEAMQGADRPLAVNVHVGDPDVTEFVLTVNVELEPDVDEDMAFELIRQTLMTTYSPAGFAYDPNYPGNWRPPIGYNRIITQFDVAGIVDDLPGVLRVTGVDLDGGLTLTLPGWAPLPSLTLVDVV